MRYVNDGTVDLDRLPELVLTCSGANGQSAGAADDKGYSPDVADSATYDTYLGAGETFEGTTEGWGVPDDCADPLFYLAGVTSDPAAGWQLDFPRGYPEGLVQLAASQATTGCIGGRSCAAGGARPGLGGPV